MAEVKPPRVFISYSHDSEEHKFWVLKFATALRERGADVVLDMWDLKPGADLPSFMEENLRTADYILMICTEKYVAKANNGSGGVGYEKMIMTSQYLSNINANKVIPVIRQFGTFNVPTFQQTKLFVNMSEGEDQEFRIDELLRTFFNAPLFVKPEIGQNSFATIEGVKVKETSDATRYFMSIISDLLNIKKSSVVTMDWVYKSTDMHKIAVDQHIKRLYEMELIVLAGKMAPMIHLTEKGLHYLFANQLVSLDII